MILDDFGSLAARNSFFIGCRTVNSILDHQLKRCQLRKLSDIRVCIEILAKRTPGCSRRESAQDSEVFAAYTAPDSDAGRYLFGSVRRWSWCLQQHVLPSGKHTKSYWKWLFIVDLPIKNGGSFHSYVSLPEGKIRDPKTLIFSEGNHWFLGSPQFRNPQRS